MLCFKENLWIINHKTEKKNTQKLYKTRRTLSNERELEKELDKSKFACIVLFLSVFLFFCLKFRDQRIFYLYFHPTLRKFISSFP